MLHRPQIFSKSPDGYEKYFGENRFEIELSILELLISIRSQFVWFFNSRINSYHEQFAKQFVFFFFARRNSRTIRCQKVLTKRIITEAKWSNSSPGLLSMCLVGHRKTSELSIVITIVSDDSGTTIRNSDHVKCFSSWLSRRCREKCSDAFSR